MGRQFCYRTFMLVMGTFLLTCLAATQRYTVTHAEEKKHPISNDSGTQLPKPDPVFSGKIGETYLDSRASYPIPVTAPQRSPNVLLVLLDDVGFGMSSTFGGPVPTPVMDKLAGNGLKYTRFHTTALCSPTRGALLAGRNHHSIGTGSQSRQAMVQLF